MAVYTNTADTYYSLFNGSILSVDTLSEPLVEYIYPTDLMSFFDLILPQITSQALLLNSTYSDLLAYVCQYMSTADPNDQDAVTFLRSFLATPLLLLHNDNLNLYAPASDTEMGLSEFSVTVDFALSSDQVTIAKWTLVVFSTIAILLFLGCIALLFIIRSITGEAAVTLTSFPLVNFAAQLLPVPNSFVSLFSRIDLRTGDVAVQSNLEKVAIQLEPLGEKGNERYGLAVVSQ